MTYRYLINWTTPAGQRREMVLPSDRSIDLVRINARVELGESARVFNITGSTEDTAEEA
jgi:hypothetical protein